ncbi:MAG: lysophospholipid acyltransferase family protein [Chitinophagales bacterium]
MKLLRYLHTFYAVLIFGIFALFAIPIYFIGFGLFGQKAASTVMGYNRFWVRTWGFLTGIRYRSVNEEYVDSEKAYVYIANHRAIADIFVVAAVVPGVFHPLMKAEGGKYPIMGYLFKQFCVMVDRKSMESRQRSLLQLKERVKRGNSILVFPEGTRNRSNEILLNPFYAGAFRIAIDLQIPVVPITFLGTRDVFPNNHFLIHPATITCVFGKPIETKGLQSKDTERLKKESFEVIEGVLLENRGVLSKPSSF